MASTYSPSNALDLQAVGDNINTWGLVVNNNFNLLDQAIDGLSIVPLTGSTASVAISNGQLSSGRASVLKFTGGLSAPCTVSLPASTGTLTKVYWIINNSGQNVILQQQLNGVASATVTVSNGSSEPVLCDGQGNVTSLGASVTSAPGNFTVNGNLTVDGSETVVGDVTANNFHITGNASQLTDGTNDFSNVFNLAKFVLGLADNGPGLINGNTVLSNISVVGSAPSGIYIIFRFGTVVGSRIEVGFGQGQCNDGDTFFQPPGTWSFLMMPTAQGAPDGTHTTLQQCVPVANTVSCKWTGSGGGAVGGPASWFSMVYRTGQ